MSVRRKKFLLRLGMLISLFGICYVMATSYFNGNGSLSFYSGQAIVLSLDQSTTGSIILSESEASNYLITATVEKSATVANVNATLTITLENGGEDLTLSALSFKLYDVDDKDDDGEKELDCLSGNVFTVSGINQTSNYRLVISLKNKADGSRYTVEELQQIGGKIKIAFTSGSGGNGQ